MPYILLVLSVPLLLVGLIGLLVTLTSPFDLFNLIVTLIFLVPGFLLARKGVLDLKARKLAHAPVRIPSPVKPAMPMPPQRVPQKPTPPPVTIPPPVVGVEKVVFAAPEPEVTKIKAVDPPAQAVTKVLPQMLQGSPLAYQYSQVKTCVINKQRPDYSSLQLYMPINFTLEPTNEYDPKAVKVGSNDIDIGYLYRGRMQDMVRDFLERGDPIQAFISVLDPASDLVLFDIGFYKQKMFSNAGNDYDDMIYSEQPYKVFKLTGNRGEDMQDSIRLCSEEEKVEYDFDYEKEKYMAVCGLEIGYFPKSAEKYLEDDHPAFIEEIEVDENGKYVVKVALFYESERS